MIEHGLVVAVLNALENLYENRPADMRVFAPVYDWLDVHSMDVEILKDSGLADALHVTAGKNRDDSSAGAEWLCGLLQTISVSKDPDSRMLWCAYASIKRWCEVHATLVA